MRLSDYIKDKLLTILLNLFCMILLYVYLKLIGNDTSSILLIILFWIIIVSLMFGINFVRRRSYFNRLKEVLEHMDKRYLISEVMEPSYLLEDKIYREILHKSNKSVIEKINQLEDEQRDYKEYIETWIHEVKIPITSVELLCDNNKNELTRKFQVEFIKLENYVEMALFYARSEAVYKDYLIKEIDLFRVINETISKNKQFFIQNNMSIEVDGLADKVYCDDKWISFILNQIFMNAVKYKKEGIGRIRIYTETVTNGTKLYIEDNGIGIKESEINRIFDKGFTGTNGRERSKATGIGLYLCMKLSNKLGIKLLVESKDQEYTKVIIIFPKGSYLSKL